MIVILKFITYKFHFCQRLLIIEHTSFFQIYLFRSIYNK